MRCFLPALLCVLAVPQILPAQDKMAQPRNRVQVGYLSDGMKGRETTLSGTDASQLGKQLAADPEDEPARAKLLEYYWFTGLREQRLQLIYWLIEHHPESDLHTFQTAGIFPPMQQQGKDTWFPGGLPLNDASDYARATELWRSKTAENPKDARVLFNAARFMGFSHWTPEAIGLAEQAQQLIQARYTQPLAILYSRSLLQDRDTARWENTAARLAASTDAALIGSTARAMLRHLNQASLEAVNPANASSGNAEEIRTLLVRARSLDPQNSEWSDLLQGANRVTSSALASQATAEGNTAQPPFVVTGSGVRVPELLYSPPLNYPVDAKTQRVEGTVHLTVRIGANGHVELAKIESGPSLLVDAAKQAVAQYVYKPTFMDGQPVEVVTTVEVPFRIQ